MAVKERVLFLVSLIIIYLFMLQHHHASTIISASSSSSLNYSYVHIGVVLYSNSSIGSIVEDCMSIALSDFYALHSDYKTRLFLHTKHAQNQLDVTSQVVELIEKEQVHGIVELTTQGDLIQEIGKRVQIPIISFTSSKTSTQSDFDPKSEYFLRATPDNSNQLKAIAAICKGYEWNQITVIYEDTQSGREFFSELTKALRASYIGLSSVVICNDDIIKKDLEMVKTMTNRVLLVHMNIVLGSKLFVLAKSIGMMSKDYVWIVTDSIGNFLNSMDSTVIEAMEGVIGVRAFVPISNNLKNLRNVYGLYAYDTVWALAFASEMIGPIQYPSFENQGNGSYLSSLPISNFGPKLARQLFDVSFKGLSGEFKLINGTLKPSPLEIFNVIGTGGRTVGYWTPDGGIAENPSSNIKEYSTSTSKLRTIVWPGDSVVKPKGWTFPLSGKLKVIVPQANFPAFVNFSNLKRTNATGFCIDIFLAALDNLPFKLDYEYTVSPEGSYTELLKKISKYDIVVGDITILAERSEYVDFTLPYSESGIVMVVKSKQDTDKWVLLKPFTWDLWVTIIATCILTGIVLRVLEHRAKSCPANVTPHKEYKGLLYWFPFAALAFPEMKMVNTNWSRFVLVAWLYMTYVVMQSYTAKLSSMFTIDKLNFKPSPDMKIGYQINTYVYSFMIKQLNYSKDKLIPYSTIEDIHDGMTKGSKNGGYDAIIDEIPYIRLLLNRYGSMYKIVGHTFKSDGFGFAFPRNSPLVPYFSRAILNVIEAPNLVKDTEKKNFGPQYSSDNQIGSINQDNPSLTVSDFEGLFIIFGSAMLFALFCSWTAVTSQLVFMAKTCLPFLSFGGKNDFRTNSIVHDSSSEQKEVEMHQQINVNISILHNGSNRVSGQTGDVGESNQSEGIQEIQQSQPNHLERSI